MAAPVGPKRVHRYSLEFKIQAVRLANHPDIQTQDVAHTLDIYPFMLSKWKRDHREGRLGPGTEPAERFYNIERIPSPGVRCTRRVRTLGKCPAKCP